MIRIGVTENVYVSEQKKNDKGTLEITITEAGTEKKKLTALEMMNESSDASGSKSGSTFLLFMPSMDYQNEAKPPEKLLQSLTSFKNQLHHFLKRSVAETQIKWNVFKGIVIASDEDLMEKIQNKDTYAKIYENIVDQFVEQANRLKINDPKKLSRILCIRQSKEKHFNRLRENYLDSQPFWEAMEIPKDKSKLYVKAGTKGVTAWHEADADGFVPKFNDYELKQGLDNPIPSSTKADAGENTPEEAAKVEGVFGQQPAEPMDFSTTAEETPQFGAPETPSEVPGLTAPTEEA